MGPGAGADPGAGCGNAVDIAVWKVTLPSTFCRTFLNGHIHQVLQKVEGNAVFHTAMSTAFPQPAPGSAPAPGPMKVPAERLRSVLGLTDVHYVAQNHSLAVVDSPLAAASAEGTPAATGISTPELRSSRYWIG